MTDKKTITISTGNLYVDNALEYSEAGSRAPKHPLVELQYISNEAGLPTRYTITNRYVLFSLLRRCDPSLKYDEFMQTIYDIPIGFEDRPSFKDMINGYLGLNVVVDIETTSTHITHVTDDNTYSEYFHTTFDFIQANFLPDYFKNSSCKIKVQGSWYPHMAFLKRVDDRTITIKILSRKGKTTITGSVSYFHPDYATLQPIEPIVIPNWVHTIEASHLNNILTSVDERLVDYINEVTLDASSRRLMTGSGRLNDFNDKNKLEREYYFESLRLGKVA